MNESNLKQRPQYRGDLAAWYTAALEAQEASGMNVVNYAKEIGVTAATLYQWRRRIRGADEHREDPRSKRPGLIELKVASCALANDYELFVVHLNRKRSIELPRSYDEAELRQLIVLLESC